MLTPDAYTPHLASPSCFPSLEAASHHIRRAEDGGGFAHFDDWGVLTSYDADGHAIQHAVVAWPAAVAYFEGLGDWDAFSRTGHLEELCGRNLTDDARERVHQARTEKREQGETPWPRVPFECRSQSPSPRGSGSVAETNVEDSTAASTDGSSSTESPSQSSPTNHGETTSGPSPTSSRLKPPVPSELRRPVQQWCLNTPCTRDSDCSSQGCGTCIMRDKFLFLSCSG